MELRVMDVYFIIGNNVDLTKYDFTNKIVVGIDRGAYLAFQSNIKLDYAIGDFDSISAQELKELEGNTNVIKLNPIKDETDTLYALRMFKKYDNLYLLGGITGSRIDHFVANLKLFYEFPNLTIIDNDTLITKCEKNQNFQKDEYKYYSFFALEDVYDLCLKGFKYELENHYLSHTSALGVSNEVIDNAFLSYSKGRLLLIKTKE
jgi:thiamine pyrophosphokinase